MNDKWLIFRMKNKTATVSIVGLMTMLYFCKQSCTNFATAIGFSTSITAGVILISFFGLFILYFLLNLRNIRWDGVVLLTFCAFFFWITLQFHPEYINRYEDIYNNGRFSASAVFALGAGIYTYYIIRIYNDDVERIYDVFRPLPYIIFVLNLFTFLNRSSEYAMDFGYQMEMAAILFLAQYLHDEKNIHKLILSLFAIFYAVVYGARASIVGYVVFIAIYMFWSRKLNGKKIIFVLLGIIGVVIYSSQEAMLAIYNLLVSMGIESRTLYLIAMGDILSADTARQERIWPVLIEKLNDASFFKMYGAFGDRYYISSIYPYAHNIVLEILLTFGKCFGGIILIAIIVGFIRTCINNKSKGGYLTIAFGSYAICKLMFSSSFWVEPYFWAFLAMVVNCHVKYRKVGKVPIESDTEETFS